MGGVGGFGCYLNIRPPIGTQGLFQIPLLLRREIIVDHEGACIGSVDGGHHIDDFARAKIGAGVGGVATLYTAAQHLEGGNYEGVKGWYKIYR